MNTRNDRYVENSDPHQKGWLNLSLGQGIGGSSSCEVSGPTTPKKLYTCSFCGRRFYSPQALGGHQNAHRRERDAARKHSAFQINQSMEMHSHLLVGTTGIITKDKSGSGVTYDAEKLVEFKWPGSSYSNSQLVSQETDPITLDLNLRL